MVATRKAAETQGSSLLQALLAGRQVTQGSRKDFNALRLDSPIDPSEIIVRLNKDKRERRCAFGGCYVEPEARFC